jgi:hypothetical protein
MLDGAWSGLLAAPFVWVSVSLAVRIVHQLASFGNLLASQSEAPEVDQWALAAVLGAVRFVFSRAHANAVISHPLVQKTVRSTRR